MLIIAAAVVALTLLIFGIMVWNAISWMQNAPEPQMASYEPLKLSPGEQEDVTRILTELGSATQTGTDVDEYVSPQVFNGVMEKLMEDEKKKKSSKPDAPLYVRASLPDHGFDIKLTVPATDQKTKEVMQNMYVNADVRFDVEVANGQITELKIERVTLRDEPAPMIARWVYNYFIDAWKQQQAKTDWSSIRTLKREGERVHFVLDGKKLKEQEDAKKNRKNGTPAPEKTPPPAEKKEE
jgi:hypothetical protein